MDREILYRYFDGDASTEEVISIKEWIGDSSGNMKIFLKERRFYDMTLLSGESCFQMSKYDNILQIINIGLIFAGIIILSMIFIQFP